MAGGAATLGSLFRSRLRAGILRVKPLPIARSTPALTDFGREVERCTFCPKLCRHVCPVAATEGRESATPTAKGALLRGVIRGERPLAGAAAEAAYRCTDCAHQLERCEHGVHAPDVYAAARREAFATGVAPLGVLSYVRRLNEFGNPFRAGLERELAERVAAAGGAVVRTAAIALFPGCAATAHDLGEAIAARALLDVPVAAAGAGCCGYPWYAAGDLRGFTARARAMSAALAGFDEVAALDPGCAHTLTSRYAEVGVALRPRVTTAVEALYGRRDRLSGRWARALEPAAYHDACYLGRFRGVFDEPRALLAAAQGGAPVVELAGCRRDANCSGAGAVYGKVWPERAEAIARERIEELDASGATTLVTGCPSARRLMARAGGAGRVVGLFRQLSRAID